jgi:hypothetical protein
MESQLNLLKDPTPIPNLPLNKVQPPTPDLTPDQIIKIQKNLEMLKDFNKDLWLQQGQIISEVWSRLKSQYDRVKQSNTNSADGKIAEVLEIDAFIFGIGALIPSPLEPVFAVCALVLEVFGLPGNRYESHPDSDYMLFKFKSKKDADLCRILLSERF